LPKESCGFLAKDAVTPIKNSGREVTNPIIIEATTNLFHLKKLATFINERTAQVPDWDRSRQLTKKIKMNNKLCIIDG
jgi:hypothetical protein